MFQFLEQARKNNNNPMDLFKQVTSNFSSEQMTNLIEKAKEFGIPDNVLQKIQSEK